LLIDGKRNGKLAGIFNSGEGHTVLKSLCVEDLIKDRIVCVSDMLFSELVNSALEVRTSVSIDPETGAAAEGALFTYEAIPRATILWCDVILYDTGIFPSREHLDRWRQSKFEDKERHYFKQLGVKEEDVQETAKEILQAPSDYNSTTISDFVERALGWLETMGVGGMLTRGFGRLKAVFTGDAESCRKNAEKERVDSVQRSEKQSAGGADDD